MNLSSAHFRIYCAKPTLRLSMLLWATLGPLWWMRCGRAAWDHFGGCAVLLKTLGYFGPTLVDVLWKGYIVCYSGPTFGCGRASVGGRTEVPSS